MSNIIRVADDESEARLDRFLMRRFPGLSFGQAQKLLRTGQVRVDGKRSKADMRVAAGQEIRLPPFLTENAKFEPDNEKKNIFIPKNMLDQFAKSIIFEDEHMLAINKPPGLAVQGGSKTNIAVDGIAAAWAEAKGQAKPKLVHRLDKDTSGVLLLAKTQKAAASLTRAFAGKKTEKIYWAVVQGIPKPESGTIDLPITKKMRKDVEKVEVDFDEGDFAVTHYRILDVAGFDFAFVELQPVTGRTHQLRVHCQAIGTPILGDPKYGKPHQLIDGLDSELSLHLHARRIRLPHPARGAIDIVAPLPPVFGKTVRYFNFDTESD